MFGFDPIARAFSGGVEDQMVLSARRTGPAMPADGIPERRRMEDIPCRP
jgi:hypothetical protein